MAQKTIQSSRFGELIFEDERVIRFVRPIIGFDSLREYILLDHKENSPFRWLQSTEDATLAFVVTNPNFFDIPYEFDLPDDVADELHLTTIEDLVALNIVKIPHNNPNLMTANLVAPLIINTNTREGAQIILSDTTYSTQTRLLPDQPAMVSTNPATTAAPGIAAPAQGEE